MSLDTHFHALPFGKPISFPLCFHFYGKYSPPLLLLIQEWECEYVALEVRGAGNQLFRSRLLPDSVENRSSDGVAVRRVL
jgi:hypothetical protein